MQIKNLTKKIWFRTPGFHIFAPIKQTTKKIMNEQITKDAIRKAIVKNPSVNRAELATKLGVTLREVGAMYASLKRYGVIESVELPKEPKKRGRKPKESKNTYHNENGQNKAIARQKMAEIIIKSGVHGVIPTLPNTNWAIEQMIDKATDGNLFLGVERDKDTYKKMNATLRNLKKTTKFFGSTHLGNISEIIYGKNENSFAHMILDYCGNLVTIKKELEYAIQNNVLAVGGIMAVTFAKAIRGTGPESLKLLELAAENNTDARCASDKAVEAYFQKITGFSHKVVEFFHYCDTSPMTLVLIKRVK
jgi:hypothetical protein